MNRRYKMEHRSEETHEAIQKTLELLRVDGRKLLDDIKDTADQEKWSKADELYHSIEQQYVERLSTLEAAQSSAEIV